MLYLQDRDYEPQVAATLAINPRYGVIFNVLYHFATMTRRTGQAAQFARRAIEIAPRLWSAHLNLGMALLRMGQMEAGRIEVEKSFKGDPFNVWAKNTLDLLDAMADYKETKRGPFAIKAAAKESDVLAGYAANLLEEAAAKLTARYRFTPEGPITVELFPNHEDFAVRALGLPGLGALGVCFGQVIAQDSPSARETGDFNWGSTLWHEYTHVITLQITNYRIPRWFSEGLSVYEERRARPGWGDRLEPSVSAHLRRGTLVQDWRSRGRAFSVQAIQRICRSHISRHRKCASSSRSASGLKPFFACWRSIAKRHRRQISSCEF